MAKIKVFWAILRVFVSNIARKGLAYENVAFNHISQIKEALGIKSVSTIESTFYEATDNEAAQIDMVIERKDNIVNMCDIKFYSDLYVGNKNSHLNLVRKNRVLGEYIKKRQTIYNTLITTYGIKDNEYRFDDPRPHTHLFICE